MTIKLGRIPVSWKDSKELEKDSIIARVVSEYKESYRIQSLHGNFFRAEITGNLRFRTESREDFPAVGDWVLAQEVDSDFAIIREIAPRFSSLVRKSVGSKSEKQIIATNVDIAFLIQAVNDFNPNRLERYIIACQSGNVEPIILMTKRDLLAKEELERISKEIVARFSEIQFFFISNHTKEGFPEIQKILSPEKTFCTIGSSGAGKSSFINNLLGENYFLTKEISDKTNKGKHTTTHREMVVHEKFGVLIDTPGMREFGLVESQTGLEKRFERISELTEGCKFTDCTHTNEKECRILEALENGELDGATWDNYNKLQREEDRMRMNIFEKRQKEKKQGKMSKDILSGKQKRKGFS